MHSIFTIQGSNVQQVGYRPFLQSVSLEFDVDVVVRNSLSPNLVEVEVQGLPKSVEAFYHFLSETDREGKYLHVAKGAGVNEVSKMTEVAGELNDVVILKQGNKLIFEQLSKGIVYQKELVEGQKEMSKLIAQTLDEIKAKS
ncbi:MAG: acylphosphatase [Candidatus Diapherotrites archaeon]